MENGPQEYEVFEEKGGRGSGDEVELVKKELMTVVVVVVVVVVADKCCEGTRGTAAEKLRKSTELNRKNTYDTK